MGRFCWSIAQMLSGATMCQKCARPHLILHTGERKFMCYLKQRFAPDGRQGLKSEIFTFLQVGFHLRS